MLWMPVPKKPHQSKNVIAAHFGAFRLLAGETQLDWSHVEKLKAEGPEGPKLRVAPPTVGFPSCGGQVPAVSAQLPANGTVKSNHFAMVQDQPPGDEQLLQQRRDPRSTGLHSEALIS